MNVNEECLLQYLNNPERLDTTTEILSKMTNPMEYKSSNDRINLNLKQF